MKLARRVCLLLPLLAACNKPAGHETSGGATVSQRASAVAASAPAAAASSSASVAAPLLDPTCRVLRVEGEAKLGGAPLRSGAELDGAEWVTLGVGASLTLKHAASGREIALAGPALFRACRRGREQVLLARGKARSGTGMGSRPGAEVLIATPLFAVRYGDADFTLTLDDKKLTVEVRTGQVEVDAATDQPPKSLKTPLRANDKLSLPLGKPDPVALLARCKSAAENAEATARRVGDRSSPEPLGERAKAHVRARKAARSVCTVAAAATGLVADPDARAGLWAEALRWEGLWETIPRWGRVQPAEK